MIRAHLPKNTEELARWYMRYISPLALIAGFVADNLFLLRRVDMWSGNVLLFSYLIIAATCIVVLNLIQAGRMKSPFAITAAPLIPVFAQFAFGGLFSGYLSLYSRSAAFSVSWIFVLIVAALLLGNERFVRQYMKFSFQISIFFTSLFSFLIFFLPVVFRQVGSYMFYFSGLASLCVIALLLLLLYWLTPSIVRSEWQRAARAIGVIFVVFNILYITNAIPPLPLALKDAGIYHGITRNPDGSYTLLSLPFVLTGWNQKLFGVILSAYATGLALEDITWYLVNPAVRFRELYTPFSDYYPWIKIGGRKIIPAGYVAGVAIALLSWLFLWK